jgi:chorismate synthase
MAGNSIGHIFSLTTFGESHGTAIGGVIGGCPPNFELDLEAIQVQLDRRKPGQSSISTQRKESDKVEFLSGIVDGKTLGTSIGFIMRNDDQKSKDYDKMKDLYRPSHADYTYQEKYGIRDYRGGGRSSARETACRVVAGAIAQQILKAKGIHITAFVTKIGHLELTDDYRDTDFSKIDDNIVRTPSAELADEMIKLIKEVRAEGDSLGGVVKCVIENPIVGLGEPIFDRLNADLAKAMFSVPAVKGFELGSGFQGVSMKGSEHNDEFTSENGVISTKTNRSGGIQGGISNGEKIYFNVAFKPVATIVKEQNTVDMDAKEVKLSAEGRHDPCVVPRAVPIVESMAAIIMLDHLLRQQAIKLK